MIDRKREAGTGIPSAKRPWSEPRIESIEGREAHANVVRYGGVDGGFYS